VTNECVKLLHGSGQGLHQLLHEVVLPALDVGTTVLEDAAVLPRPGAPIAFTTDSFVVNPLTFAGGDIGKLSACGTINDLAMMGARPRFLSLGLIIEEGLSFSLLRTLCGSFAAQCAAANVSLACGDTKVVESGKGDGLFINTSGIGELAGSTSLSASNARPGDRVIVSGPIGQHGIAIMTARNRLGFSADVVSDCAPLHEGALGLLHAVPDTRVMRDATRGGIAAVLNEIADDSKVTIVIDESTLPATPAVRAACDYLGLDLLHVANEGRFVAVVAPDAVDTALTTLRALPFCDNCTCIGTIQPRERFGVLAQTTIGGLRPVEVPPGRLLPRIC